MYMDTFIINAAENVHSTKYEALIINFVKLDSWNSYKVNECIKKNTPEIISMYIYIYISYGKFVISFLSMLR